MTSSDWRRLAEIAEECAVDVTVNAGAVYYITARAISAPSFIAALRREADRVEIVGVPLVTRGGQ